MNSIYATCIFLLLFSFRAFAQPGPFKIYRCFDDFSYLLGNDTLEKKYYEHLKYMPLSKDKQASISIGGELREQYQLFRNINFGDLRPGVEEDKNGHLWHRFMLHADVRLGEQWRLFTQINSTFAFNKPDLTPQIDEDPLALHQAFIQWRPKGTSGFFAQLGRQEISFASPYIVAVREVPNNRLNFDAIMLGLEKKSYKLYSFLATPIISQNGVLDNSRIPEYIWSLYGVFPLGKRTLDAYYVGFYSENNAYNFQRGIENRQTLGMRMYQRAREGLVYDMLAMYQFGNFNSASISAYYLSADAAFRIPLKGHSFIPGFSLKYISGDKSPTDNVLNTYNMLFSKPSFGLSIPIGATNLVDLGPSFEYNPPANFRIIMSSHFMWRQNENDGIYTPGRVQTRPNVAQLFQSDQKDIGQKLSMELWYLPDYTWNLYFELTHILPGMFVKETGQGQAISYFSGKFTFKF
ncbi:MAG: alginate export family protein [Bacteroidia bacterium]|nr:alginate export family protein [Bacteroidia bacterium]